MTDNTQPEALRHTKYLTAVYRDINPGDEARELIMHPKMTALSWSHVMNERDRLQDENANLNAGYAAARLEIESLQARIKTMAEEHADELTVVHLDGRMCAAQVMPESIRSILVRCRNFIDTTKVPAYPAGADLADEIDVLLAAQPAGAQAAHSSAAQTANCTYPACQIASGCGGACRRQLAQPAPAAVAGPSEMHEAMCPALTGGRCTCERNDPAVDKAWARFCGGIGDGPDAPYPGMISAFERYYSQSFTDKDWRNEASVWAAAWKQALLTAAAPTTQPAPPPLPTSQGDALNVTHKGRCQHCIDRHDGVYGSWAAPCPYHDDDGNLRIDADRAARAPADSALKDHQIAALVNELRDIAVEFHGTQQLRDRIARVVVPALKAKTADSVTAPVGAGVAHALSDGQIEAMPVWRNFVGLWPESRREIVDAVVDLLTTPPAQAADSVLEDAARLDWLLLHISGAEFRRIGVHYSGNARRADVDAARKQGANHD